MNVTRVAETQARSKVAPVGTPSPIIQTEQLCKIYRMGNSQVHALRAINLQILPGAFIALMGTSGSGKSSLLHILGCLDRPTTGAYFLEGKAVSALSNEERSRVRNRRIGFIFQNFNLLPRLTALENACLPLLYQGHVPDARHRAMQVLERVGLGKRAHHLPNELSGGERQRVAIARALIVEPALILADEPTGSLDSLTGREVMGLLCELWQEGRTILVVTHDPGVAAYAQRSLHMQDGSLLDEEGGPK